MQSGSWTCVASCFLALVANSVVATAQEPRALPTSGVDGDGDALPGEALARLGSKRWRHRREGRSLSWSPDGKKLAYVSEFRYVRILDADTGRLLLEFEPRTPDGVSIGASGVVISPDGLNVAVYGGRHAATFSVEAGKHLRTYELKLSDFGHSDCSPTYSPDGRLLAVASGSDYAVLDQQTGKTILHEDTRAEIQGMSFTRDSKQLVVAGLKPLVKVWDLARAEIVARWSFSDDFFVWGPAISPDGKLVAIGHKAVIVVDPFAGKEKVQLSGDDPSDLFLHLAFTPDGRHLIAASQEGPVYVWSTADWSRQRKLLSDASSVRSMALRPDGKHVAIGDAHNRIWVWSLETGELLAGDVPGHDMEIQAVTFTADGKSLVTGSGGLDTNVWDVRTGKHQWALGKSSNSLTVMPHGRLLSSWYGNPLLRTWDLGTGKQLFEWTAPEARIRAFARASGGEYLAVLCDVDTPRGFDLMRLAFPSLTVSGDIKQEGHTRGTVATSPEGSLAALAPIGGVELWSFADEKQVAFLENADHFSDELLFTADGRFLIASSSDKSLLIWEVASCQLVHRLVGHLRMTGAIAASPSGRILASAGGSRSIPIAIDAPRQIRFWDLRTGKQVAALSGHDEDVSALAFSPDGKLLAAGMRDTTTLIWTVPTAAQESAFEPQQLSLEETEALWAQLTSDGKQAQAAIARLLRDSSQALSMAQRRLSPVQSANDAEVRRLIAALDSNEFKDRAAAYEGLASLGSTISPQLRAALDKTQSAEVKLRCAELLQVAARKCPQTGTRLAETRAVQLLEQIADERAQALLTKLAGGAPEAYLTCEAKAALQRMLNQPSPR